MSIEDTTSLQKTKCNDCGIPKFDWQYHWRIEGIERLKVCKTCRNGVNQMAKQSTIDTQMEEINKQMAISSEETVMPFGKYKSQTIEEVPNYYLTWLLEDDTMTQRYAHLVLPIETELNYRKQYNIFIE